MWKALTLKGTCHFEKNDVSTFTRFIVTKLGKVLILGSSFNTQTLQTDFLLMKLESYILNLTKQRLRHRCFLVDLQKNFQNSFSAEHLPVTASS